MYGSDASIQCTGMRVQFHGCTLKKYFGAKMPFKDDISPSSYFIGKCINVKMAICDFADTFLCVCVSQRGRMMFRGRSLVWRYFGLLHDY